jgi:hypothetical protein
MALTVCSGALWPGRSQGVALQVIAAGCYRHGKIVVLDRPKLEARVCECYAVVKREYERLLPAIAIT